MNWELGKSTDSKVKKDLKRISRKIQIGTDEMGLVRVDKQRKRIDWKIF